MTLKKLISTPIKHSIRYFGYELRKVGVDDNKKELQRDDFFSLYFSQYKNNQNFNFIQIGANDGKYGDPIYKYVSKYKLKGVVVEPLPKVFELLKENHAMNPNITFVNAAVSADSKNFYSIDEEKLPNLSDDDFLRLTGIASFDRNLFSKRLKQVLPKILQRKMNDFETSEYVLEVEIENISLDELMTKCSVEEVDLLFMDCQGKDLEILKSFDFKKYKPSLINFENRHLSCDERIESERILNNNGYSFFHFGNDTCAYKV